LIVSESGFQDVKDIVVDNKGLSWRESHARVLSIQRTAFTMKGDMAWDLMKRFAVVAADLEGEDSEGRAQYGLLSPEQVAKRACEIAENAWAEFESRGWLQQLPAAEPIIDLGEK
jgi:hypothetical protein